jgi:hypothetical protein
MDEMRVYIQSRSNFPSWHEELREHADVNLRCASSTCALAEARERP